MRRLQEILDESNGDDAIARLDEVRAKRLIGRDHYSKVLGEELGAVASETLVVRNGQASGARAEARHITNEHDIVPAAASTNH
jgi:uncharacterized protein YrrD